MSQQLITYNKLVTQKYNLYNSLFLNLPFQNINNTGTYIPLLLFTCQEGFKKQLSPKEILEQFFLQNNTLKTEEEQIQFMFRVVQYVERQVVLFDSVEDASFKQVNEHSANLSLKEIIKSELKEETRAKIIEKLNAFSVRLVFTAHPTQFYPLTVLDIINRLRTYVSENNIEEIDLCLQQLGLTSFIQKEKPTPFQEAKNIIYYLRNVYYNAIGNYYFQLKKELKNHELENPDVLNIGFWPGGDRDGNPFVTSETTYKVAEELRTTLMKCYYNEVKQLETKVTFSKTSALIAPLRESLYQSIFNPKKPLHYTQILQPLLAIRQLIEEDYNSLFIEEVDKLIAKIEVFKNHFASIDIRQNHEVHQGIIEQIFIQKKYISTRLSELKDAEITELLFTGDLSVNSDSLSFPNDDLDVMKNTFLNFKQLKEIQELNGEKGCCRYIISNSEDVFSVAFVYGIFRSIGLEPKEISFDIVPLFETMDGMKNSEQIMTDLFENPTYKKHLAYRNQHQTIMLGFSDGTKDGGYVKANWSIFKTKESLSQLCSQHGIEVVFFDGRGGPPARGGGKTHRFYASQSDLIANNEIQLTIQGQTITSTYGTEEQFTYNCEQMLTAGIQNHIASLDSQQISAQNRNLMELISEESFAAYTDLKNHPRFISYLEKMSTLQYYGKANIGSRPGKRGGTKQLTLEDLRAISFVGAWSQLKQNVPGYFGIGSALQKLKEEGRLEEVKQLFEEVPFFKALINNSMMSLLKSYFPLTNYMNENAEFKDFWNILHSEYQLTKDLLLEISGYESLMQEEQISKESIEIREKIVLPLLTIQQFALQKIAENSVHKETYEKLVIRSLYGNINASRNSA